MKKRRGISGILLMILVLAILPSVLAQADNEPKILPDSPLWTLKTLGQDMRLLVTFNQEDKLRLRLNYMEERLNEISLAKSTIAIEKARLNYQKHLNKLNPISKEQMVVMQNSISRHLVVLNQVKLKLEAKNVTTQGIDNAIMMSSKLKEGVQAKNGASVLIEQGEL